jgi:hypothetical protein
MLVEPVAHGRPEGLPRQRISMVELRHSPAMLTRIVIINDVATARGHWPGASVDPPFARCRHPRHDDHRRRWRQRRAGTLGVDVAAVGREHIAKAGIMSALAKGIYNPASLSRTEIVAGSNRSWTWKPLRCG